MSIVLHRASSPQRVIHRRGQPMLTANPVNFQTSAVIASQTCKNGIAEMVGKRQTNLPALSRTHAASKDSRLEAGAPTAAAECRPAVQPD